MPTPKGGTTWNAGTGKGWTGMEVLATYREEHKRLKEINTELLAVLAEWSAMERRADDSGANGLGFYLAQAKEYNALLERARAAIAKATGA